MSRNISARWRASTPASAAVARRIESPVTARAAPPATPAPGAAARGGGPRRAGDRRRGGCASRSSLRRAGKLDPELAPAPERRLHTDAPAHALHALAHDGEADAGAGVIVGAVQPLEHAKD